MLQLIVCPLFIDKKMEVYGSLIEELRMELKYRQRKHLLLSSLQPSPTFSLEKIIEKYYTAKSEQSYYGPKSRKVSPAFSVCITQESRTCTMTGQLSPAGPDSKGY